MYLLELEHDGARLGKRGRISLRCGPRFIRKWTVLDDGARSVEMARMIAMACLGPVFVPLARRFTPALCCAGAGGLRLEFRLLLHPPRDCPASAGSRAGGCFRVLPDGTVEDLPAGERRLLGVRDRVLRIGYGSGIRTHFALAYGSRWTGKTGDDQFGFADPHQQRFQRVNSIFDEDARLTDAPAFLERLKYRVRKGRKPAMLVLERLARLSEQHLASGAWHDPDADFARIWSRLPRAGVRLLLPIVDAVRHVIDATPHELDPLNRPGVIVMTYPQRPCPPRRLGAWFTMMDRLFPKMQFVVVLPAGRRALLPGRLARKRLSIKPEECRPARRTRGTASNKHRPARFPKDTVLLLDVDSRIPNLALMKLGGWLRAQGRKVMLLRRNDCLRARGDAAEQAYASCVFRHPASQRRVCRIRERLGDRVSVGGSGEDLSLRLPTAVETAQADFSLYPELGDRALGFLTRGCARKCRFCIVPQKEGRPRQVSDLDELLQGRNKLVLLDDNLLSHPRADALLEQMADRGIRVNWNQTLDLGLVDKARAALLRRIDCANYRFSRRNYHFSLNNARGLERLRRCYDHFGFHTKENVEFICMYGFDTSLAEDVERFRFLRSLPGAYVFVQEYQVPPGGAPGKPDGFFDATRSAPVEALIDELISICFPQNMKSMEKYYGWLSRRYLEAFGELYMPLVDTLFRYNHRDQKGLYIARMREHAGSM
ncbi:MAG: hypothetical protein V2A76_13830 [Planctomycetota bacterium]